MDLSAIIDEFNRRKAQAGQSVNDLIQSQPVRRVTDFFTPNEASAEVIPMDKRMEDIKRYTAEGGGQAASTLRLAMMLPQATVARSEPGSYDRHMRGLVDDMYPGIQNTNPKEYERLVKNTHGMIDGLYTSNQPVPGKEKIGDIVISPTTGQGNTKYQASTFAHELGHFIVDSLGFRPRLEQAGVNEEDFSDFLGGFTNPPPGHIHRTLASELFQRAQTPNVQDVTRK